MKILFCTNKMNDGGAERVVSLWMRGFKSLGNEIALVLCTRNDYKDYSLPAESDEYNIYPSRSNRFFAFFDRIIKLRKIIKKENPDLIITALGPWGLWAYLAALGLHKRIIHTEHNSFERPVTTPMTKVAYFYKFVINKLFSDITVLTCADKNYIGHRLKNVNVLPNPLAYEPVVLLPNKEKIVLAAGRLDAWHVKGFDILMKAWNIVSPQHPDWKLFIAGGGSEDSLSFLRNMLNQDIIERVKFVGFTRDIVSLYQKSSIFVLSSRFEGFGMVLIEAMSQGCACVTTDYNGRQREIVNDSSYGLVCPPDNIELLADCISTMINDDVMRSMIQESCIERSKDYSLCRIMEKWNTIINKN